EIGNKRTVRLLADFPVATETDDAGRARRRAGGAHPEGEGAHIGRCEGGICLCDATCAVREQGVVVAGAIAGPARAAGKSCVVAQAGAIGSTSTGALGELPVTGPAGAGG